MIRMMRLHQIHESKSWKTLMCQRYCEVLYHDLFPQRLFVAWKRCDTKMCFDGVFHTWMYFIFWSRLKLIWWSAASWQKSKMAISKDQILHLSVTSIRGLGKCLSLAIRIDQFTEVQNCKSLCYIEWNSCRSLPSSYVSKG